MKIRSTLWRAAAVAAVLSPFSLSVLGNGLGEPTSRVEQNPRDALAFRGYLVNLGRVPEGRPVPAPFQFANTGSTPLKILGTSASCGCLVPRLEKRLYAPGEQGLLVVQADTASVSFAEQANGNTDQIKEHFVVVRYDAGAGERTARINVKYILPARRVVVEPRAIIVYQFSDKSTEREIVVTDRRTPPIDVTNVECLSDELTVTSDVTVSDGDPTRARIALNVPPVQRRLQTEIWIHTNDPEQPRIRVPIDVQVPKTDTATMSASETDRPRTDVR